MKTKLNKNQNGFVSESGRSMVEMLGVLAIIGVISIGAIAGYTYGMNRYRTNEILDGANKRAYTVATQLSMGLQPNLSEFKDVNETAGGTFGNTAESVKQWDGEFGISVSGVTKPVCENLIRMIGDNTPLRALSKGDGENETELSAGDCSDEGNDFYLVYNIGGVGGSSSGGGYCATHECTDTCGINNVPCAKFDDDWKAYDDAVAQCGGEENIFTAEEFGCTQFYKSCTNAPSSGVYWIAGDIDIDALATASGYSSAEAMTSAYGYSSAQELKSLQALCVVDGLLSYNDRRYPQGGYPLCK